MSRILFDSRMGTVQGAFDPPPNFHPMPPLTPDPQGIEASPAMTTDRHQALRGLRRWQTSRSLLPGRSAPDLKRGRQESTYRRPSRSQHRRSRQNPGSERSCSVHVSKPPAHQEPTRGNCPRPENPHGLASQDRRQSSQRTKKHRPPNRRGQGTGAVQRRQARRDRADPGPARRGSRAVSGAGRSVQSQPPASEQARERPGRADGPDEGAV